nr:MULTISPECIES: hypothetical protein [unclassified Xenorhabdus]
MKLTAGNQDEPPCQSIGKRANGVFIG